MLSKLLSNPSQLSAYLLNEYPNFLNLTLNETQSTLKLTALNNALIIHLTQSSILKHLPPPTFITTNIPNQHTTVSTHHHHRLAHCYALLNLLYLLILTILIILNLLYLLILTILLMLSVLY